MSDIAVMTDSNCGLMPEEGKKYGIHIIPMPVLIDGRTYYEGVDIQEEEFYKKLGEGAMVTSSQPSPADVMNMWDELLKKHDQVVHIPMSGGLSNSCQSALVFAEEDMYKGRVHVVDNHRISVTLTQSLFDAQFLAQQGRTGREIKEILERESMDASIYIAVNTLEYLKRGGRITAAAAAIGTVLNLKPVLTIQGDKLDAYSKKRGMKTAFRTMVKALEDEMGGRFRQLREEGKLGLGIANTYMREEEMEEWKQELSSAFPDLELRHIPLTLSIGCHIGPGGIGVGIYRKYHSI